ncbi:PEP-CTERM sorting domain-containing protein [Luteolibacter sp. SL250]|uniref:PEP-CTERM sorting domain-containing protein n=1 Tax=Luteolibacter sp. SL250 TaxID=2995170 RepID=UPI00226E1364|nr:PEP-CTERM sorting domain-containing protein [Luteolibacter sp. SL250]WAC18287.1 PEP-CTERM sorting domain-containing protein [Luteolibacter sp. SL250]
MPLPSRVSRRRFSRLQAQVQRPPTSISISDATNTAYIQGSYTPGIADIFTGERYHTFSVTLTSGYNLGSLTFQYGGTNLTSSASTTAFAAQIQIGTAAFADLPVTSGATIPGNTSSYTPTGTYNADLSAYQNVTGTVTVRIFAGDNSNDNGASARIKDVALNATAVPEPATAASLAAGLAVFALRRRRRA